MKTFKQRIEPSVQIIGPNDPKPGDILRFFVSFKVNEGFTRYYYTVKWKDRDKVRHLLDLKKTTEALAVLKELDPNPIKM